jgi:hypothetical protein
MKQDVFTARNPRLRCGNRNASTSHPCLPLTIITIPKQRIGPQIIGMLDM